MEFLSLIFFVVTSVGVLTLSIAILFRYHRRRILNKVLAETSQKNDWTVLRITHPTPRRSPKARALRWWSDQLSLNGSATSHTVLERTVTYRQPDGYIRQARLSARFDSFHLLDFDWQEIDR